MTEDKAKTKWCPFARVGSSAVAWPSLNRDAVQSAGNMSDLTLCIGSACMAWRATDNEATPSPTGAGAPLSKSAGYCGLAGPTR